MAKKEKMLATKSGRKNVINCIIALIIAVVFLFPIYWILAMSFKTDAESFGKIVTYYPHEFTIDPWVKNLSDREFLNSLRNSAVIAVLSMVLSMVFGVPAAYGMGRYKVPGQKTFMLTFLVTQMLPASLMLTPMYLIFNKLHLLGTIAPMVIPAWFGGSAYFTFMLRQFFQTIPKELDEAARVDGAGYFKIYCKIILPLTKPALIVVALFSFVNAWNEFFYTVIYLNGHQELKTLTLGLYMFKGVYSTNYGAVLALAAIISIPALLFFLIGNRYFVEGISMTGIKG